MKKGLAIKIASGILVVALVVVVALAFAGVFSGKKATDAIVANAEDASVSNVAVIRNIATDKVFYISSGKTITDVNSYVNVRANGENVDLKIYDKDADGNVGFIAKNGWAAGVAYRVSLLSGDVAFVEEQYKDMTSFIFIVKAEEALDCEVSEKVVDLNKGGAYEVFAKDASGVATKWGIAGAFELEALEYDDEGLANKWTLTVYNVDAKFADDSVFTYEDKLDITKIGDEGVLHSYALKLDPNTPAAYDADSKQYVATVVNAKIDDVFDVLNVHTNVQIDEDNFKFDEEATINSIKNSAMYLATVNYLYGEQLGSKDFNLGEYGKLSLNYDFKTGSPCYVKFDIELTFKGFLKSAKDAFVTIKIANVLTPEFHGNFQKNPLAFDASLDLTVDTSVTVEGGLSYSFDNTNDGNNTEANVALKNVVNKVASLVSDCLNSENKTEKSFIFATWVIPIGTTPIQVVESMGIEVKAEVRAKIGASLKNVFRVELGVAYCDNNLTPISNVKDDFGIDGISLWGTIEAKVGLYNEIGITACGIISVNLDLSVGVYCDVGGRLMMGQGWTIKNGEFGIDPAYYVETGIYLDMDISGKVLVFNIKKQRLLSKKWPLWSTGYKYIPQVVSEITGVEEESEQMAAIKECTATEDYYMNGSYFFFTTFKAYSIDIMNINDTGSIRNIDWDEFNYEFDKELINMVDNKVRVAATAPNQFETDITITSKVNRAWKKVIHVIKTPEAPTANKPVRDYLKGSNSELKYAVRLNSSKFIGLSSKEYNVVESDYEYEDNVLTLKSNLLESMGYGLHSLLFESSKGYLQLGVNVYSNRDIVPANGFKTAKFDKGTPVNAEFDIDLMGYEITAITGGIEEDQWVYSTSTGKLKVLAYALLDEEEGVVSYGIEFSNGEVGQLKIQIVDNRLPVLSTTVYEYKLESGADLAFDVTLYGNEITSLTLNNKNATGYLNGAAIDASYFDTLSNATTVNGAFVAAGNSYKFTINVGKDNMIILPTKYFAFDKNNAKDVAIVASIPAGIKIACDNETTGKSIGNNLVQGEESIVISADYLKGLENGKYTFKLVSAADNEPEFIIKVSDTTDPYVDTAALTAKKGEDKSKKIAWNLADFSVEEIVIDGLTKDQYVAAKDGLTLNVDALAYGVTEFKVITPVNAFASSITVSGTPRFLQSDYILTLNSGEELVIKTDLAGKRLYDIKFVKDGKEVEIYNTQFRSNDGIITISNDYAYNLAQGTYTVTVYTDENESIGSAKLVVKGELASYSDVQDEDGTYRIYTKGQFIDFIKQTNKKLLAAESFDGANFVLMADIDLENATIDPIGKKLAPFKGTFDGNGYTISNFKINDVNNDYTGLFAYNDGIIKDLRLSNVTIDVEKAGSVGIGIVAGYNSGLIKKVIVSNGKINAVSKSWLGLDIQSAYFDIGGIVGYNDGSNNASKNLNNNVERCEATVEINAEAKGLNVAGIQIGGRKSCVNVGAIVGYFKSGAIKKCDVVADIKASAKNNNVNQNGWYGNTELSAEELDDCISRCDVTVKE